MKISLFQTQTLVTDYNYIITVYKLLQLYSCSLHIFAISKFDTLQKKNRSTCIDYANKVIRLIKDN